MIMYLYNSTINNVVFSALSQIEVGPIFDNTVEDFNEALEYCFKQKINKNDSDIVSTMAKVELLTLKNGDLFFPHIFL